MLNGRSNRVGSELGAICGKCGDIWHIVVALSGDHIAQVQCGECGARHRYRPSGGTTAGGANRRKSTARKSASRSRKSAKPVIEPDASRPRRSFDPKHSYEAGDRLLHPTFGEGVVQATLGATKMEVLFEVGTKLLVQGLGGG